MWATTGAPSILCRLALGSRVDVVFDHTGPAGVMATFLGMTNGTANFLVGRRVLFIPIGKIQAISIHS